MPAIQMTDGTLPIIVVDCDLLLLYKDNLYPAGGSPPIKVFTLAALLMTVRKEKHIVVIPATHNTELQNKIRDEKGVLELQSFLSFCHIFPETTFKFEEAPIKTMELCKAKYPNRPHFLLVANKTTQGMASSAGMKPLSVDEGIALLQNIK